MTNLQGNNKTPLGPEPSRGDSSLAEILDTLWGERDLGKAWDAAQAAIAELVEGALPEKRPNAYYDDMNILKPDSHKARTVGYNEAIDEIRNNLIKAGVLNG